MKFLTLKLLFALGLAAQNYVVTRCGSQRTGEIYFVALGQVPYDTCLMKGPTLKVSLVNNIPTLDVDTSKLEIPNAPKLVPNGYYIFATVTDPVTNEKETQILPGIFYGRYLELMNFVEPTGDASCGQGYDGKNHYAYKFGRPGSIILTDDYLYICTYANKWKKIKLENVF